MLKLDTQYVATVTDLAKPAKVVNPAKETGEPVAILKNAELVGYYVPVEALAPERPAYASTEDVLRIAAERKPKIRKGLDYLRDK